ncbi:MAG TPA: hypothetical protein DEV81_26490, partial [Cyanobacteria bacterium UBA11049]|nr:hypothetical protein [Cyanobacteria bacterium UBA11049]
MKTQVLYKRLSLPLLLTVISATGIGVTPARSASLLSSQDTVIARKPPCDPPSIVPPHCDGGFQWQAPVDVDRQQQQQQQRKLQQRELQQQ